MLREYENRMASFRSGSGFSRLFLSLVGKHNPVTSSTIARWLKTCLKNAGIVTAIFQAHSVRGASASKAALSGVTVADIFTTADWSSEGTFQWFIIDLKPIPALGLGELFCHRTKLQTNMLILRPSLPKCNTRMAQGMQWPHVIRNYMRKVKLRYQHVPTPFCNPPTYYV